MGAEYKLRTEFGVVWARRKINTVCAEELLSMGIST